jgi:uncharacterized membrane protein
MSLLAHQGGWDEILWFSLPALAVLWWVRRAERSAREREERRKAATMLRDESEK